MASSTRRFWSSAVSVLRVTFSVGQDRQVGDLAADLLDRAAGLLLDVAASLLHQLLAPALALGDRLGLLVLGRLVGAGDDVVGLHAGLTQPLPVLLEQLVGLAPRGSAASIESSIACWRLSSASWMRGNARRRSRYSVTKKAIRVQIINPMPGLTRKVPESEAARRAGIV